MLQFRQLFYQVNNQILINNVSGQINAHAFIVLTGSSGSGKSLLLKLLSSLLPMSHGDITLHGKHLQELTPAAWRSQVAYLSQNGEMVEGSVLDNLRLPFSFEYARHAPFDRAWHEQQLRMLGKSSQFLQQDSRSLSGGEKQLVNLLRTLQLNPPIVLLDEPTASLDPTTTYHVETFIKNWHQSNPRATVVWVSHEPTQIQRLLDGGAIHWRMVNGALMVNEQLELSTEKQATEQGGQPCY